jgi:hypothetical protein
VAQLFALAIAANMSSKGQTSTSVLAAQKMEQLRSLAWGYAETAEGGIGAQITDTTTDLSVDPPAAGGSGLLASPADALTVNTPKYVDYLDGNGRWVGTGASPPQNTVYIRRWSITPLPASPNDTVVLQVVVTTVRSESRRKNTAAPGRLMEDTRLVSVKTRKAV